MSGIWDVGHMRLGGRVVGAIEVSMAIGAEAVRSIELGMAFSTESGRVLRMNARQRGQEGSAGVSLAQVAAEEVTINGCK